MLNSYDWNCRTLSCTAHVCLQFQRVYHLFVFCTLMKPINHTQRFCVFPVSPVATRSACRLGTCDSVSLFDKLWTAFNQHKEKEFPDVSEKRMICVCAMYPELGMCFSIRARTVIREAALQMCTSNSGDAHSTLQKFIRPSTRNAQCTIVHYLLLSTVDKTCCFLVFHSDVMERTPDDWMNSGWLNGTRHLSNCLQKSHKLACATYVSIETGHTHVCLQFQCLEYVAYLWNQLPVRTKFETNEC